MEYKHTRVTSILPVCPKLAMHSIILSSGRVGSILSSFVKELVMVEKFSFYKYGASWSVGGKMMGILYKLCG